VLLVAAQTASYSLNTNATLNHFFNPGQGGGLTSIATVYDTPSFIQAAQTFVDNYWSLPNISLARFARFHHADGRVVEPTLTLTRFASSFYDPETGSYNASDTRTTVAKYALSPDDPLGPFTVGQSTVVDLELLQSTRVAVFSIEFQSLNVGLLGAIPYRWSVAAEFEFEPGAGSCNFRLVTAKRLYRLSAQSADLGTLVGFSVFLFLWCLGSLILSFRALLRGARHYVLVRRLFEELPKDIISKYTRHYSTWESLPFSLKRKFTSFWNLWNCVAASLIVASSTIAFVIFGNSETSVNSNSDMAYSICLGLGTFFSLVNLTRYFELSRHFSVLINTLRISFRRVVAFMLSVMPIFFGYVLLGVAVFSNFSQRFSSVNQVAVALFCIANGDELHATFEDLRLTFPAQIFAQVYLYSFLALFIFGILNIIIFVVDDAFDAAKNWDRAAWKERQNFTLANLIAILELEGKDLRDRPSSHAGWQLLQMTDATPEEKKKEREEEEEVANDLPNNGSEEPPWRLSKSITKAIQIERRKKKELRDPGKDKDEEDGEEEAAIDRTFADIASQLETLKASLKRAKQQ
jgi:hypothetical protein